jgi:hypothetical protein
MKKISILIFCFAAVYFIIPQNLKAQVDVNDSLALWNFIIVRMGHIGIITTYGLQKGLCHYGMALQLPTTG